MGYKYLLAYKITVPIYDLTMQFCAKHISYKSRTLDQMQQAARSGKQNIAEGYCEKSLATYINLAGVARASQEELLEDYKDYARVNKLTIWPKERSKREIREVGEIWEILRENKILPDNPNFPNLPNNPEIAINLMITLINQATYLLDKLTSALEEKHKIEGGFSENLLKKRLDLKRRRTL